MHGHFRHTPAILKWTVTNQLSGRRFILLLIVWVRSFSKMLSYKKVAEDKVLVFVILREKCEKVQL